MIVARGNAAAKLEAEAAVGTSLTLRLILQPDWSTVSDAIGGGPVLVRDGRPVYDANEAFEVAQIAPRHPRTAVGQTKDGRILLVVVDGRQAGYSVGMTTFEMALMMVRLGLRSGDAARRRRLVDARLRRLGAEPALGRARASDLDRAHAPVLRRLRASARGGGRVAERRRRRGDAELAYKVVRPSNVNVKLTAPDGTIAFEEVVAREPGTYPVPFPPPVQDASAARPDLAASGSDRSSAASGGTLDTQHHRDRRPGPRVVGGPALRGQLDARVPDRAPGRLVLRPRGANASRSAGSRRARRA